MLSQRSRIWNLEFRIWIFGGKPNQLVSKFQILDSNSPIVCPPTSVKKPLHQRKFLLIGAARSPCGFDRGAKASYAWFSKMAFGNCLKRFRRLLTLPGAIWSCIFKIYLDEPKFDEPTCHAKNATYEALRVSVGWSTSAQKENKQEIYLGDVPVMTERGTFVINGIERVVVSQLIRSAGAFYG